MVSKRKVRVTQRDIKEGKVFTFLIYDFRKRAKENIWAYVLTRHQDCKREEGKLTQDGTLPKIRLIRFLCFNCVNAKYCYWSIITDDNLTYYPVDRQEISLKWGRPARDLD